MNKETFTAFLKNYPRIAMVLINFTTIIAILITVELGMRLFGQVPGYIGAKPGEYLDLAMVDELIVSDGFTTDSSGIFRAKPGISELNPSIEHNADGYRGNLFRPVETDQKKILFLGDSFTWGYHADPVEECFVDLIGKQGYHCYNSGIIGSEPNQYALIAKKYLPILQPDIVCLQFYMANDIMYEFIDLKPGQNKYHITNAGWLNPYLDGDWVGDAQTTYDYYFEKYTIPCTDTDKFNWFCAQTVLGTRLWNILEGAGRIKCSTSPWVAKRMEQRAEKMHDYPISYDYLVEIRDLCAAAGIPFYLFVIPQHDRLEENISEKYPKLFRDLEWHMPEDVEFDDYIDWPDGHFNNKGHKKYADFILSVIEKDLKD